MAYRRPAFCVFDRAFSLVTASDTNHQSPQIVSLPRDVAQEFVLAAALGPVLSADIAAPYLSQILATDAPEAKGAFCAADVPTDVCSYLWQASDRKGGFSRVATRSQAVLKRIDPSWEEQPECGALSGLKKPLAFVFDLLELFSFEAEGSSEMASLGWHVCPRSAAVCLAAGLYPDVLPYPCDPD